MSDRECSSSSDSSRDYNESNDSSGSGSDEHVLAGEFLPYQNEPLADPDSSSESDNDDERDEDGLSASVLRQRYENEITVDMW